MDTSPPFPGILRAMKIPFFSRKPSHHLAISINNQDARSLLFDRKGRIAGSSSKAIPSSSGPQGWIEQNPADILAAVRDTLRAAEVSAKPAVAAALMIEPDAILCWDKQTGEALSPAFSSTAAETPKEQRDIADGIRRRTGRMPTGRCGAIRMQWCVENLDAVKEAADRGTLVTSPLVSWLLFHLIEGEPRIICDSANARETLLFDPKSRDWNTDMVGLFDLERSYLPTCVPTMVNFGVLKDNGVPLYLVTSKRSASMLAGNAVPDTTTAFIELDDEATLLTALPEDGAVPEHFLDMIVLDDNKDVVGGTEGKIHGAGAALAWQLAKTGRADDIDKIGEWMTQVSNAPVFLNGIGELASPWWRHDFPTEFVGDGDSREQTVAVAESLLFMLKENLDSMALVSGYINQMVVRGELARIDGFCQRLADLTGSPVWRYPDDNNIARGAAWLVADQPEQWQADEPTVFTPTRDSELTDRFWRWQAQMFQRLKQYADID